MPLRRRVIVSTGATLLIAGAGIAAAQSPSTAVAGGHVSMLPVNAGRLHLMRNDAARYLKVARAANVKVE